IELDPYFAIAHARLANCYNNTRQLELSRAESKKAYDYRDRVSEREGFLIASSYFGGVTGEWDKQIDELEVWKRTYPRDWEPHSLLANKYTLVGPFERAVTEGHEAIDLNAREARAYVNLAVAYMGLNRLEEAKATLRQAQSQKLESANMHTRLYHIAFVQGDAAAMKEQIDWATANNKPEEAQNWQAQSAGFSGQLALANQFNDRGIELVRRSDAKEIAAQALLQEAMRSAAFGSCGPVSAITKRALELSREQAHLVNAANALAACGQSRAAE